jgi:hypothetical protein
VPISTKGGSGKSWFSDVCLSTKKAALRAFRKWKHRRNAKNSVLRDQYLELQRAHVAAVKKAKADSIALARKRILSAQGDGKKYWSLVNDVLNEAKGSVPALVSDDGQVFTKAKDKATALNAQLMKSFDITIPAGSTPETAGAASPPPPSLLSPNLSFKQGQDSALQAAQGDALCRRVQGHRLRRRSRPCLEELRRSAAEASGAHLQALASTRPLSNSVEER